MTLPCDHPRRGLALPNFASGAWRTQFQPPVLIPGVDAETNRCLRDAFNAIQCDLNRMGSRGATVPMCDLLIYARSGQTLRGQAYGQTILLPQAVPGASDPVTVIIEPGGTVGLTVEYPDGSIVNLFEPGIYTFQPAGTAGYVSTPGATSSSVTVQGNFYARASAGTGAFENITSAQAATLLRASMSSLLQSASVVEAGATLQRAALTGDVTASQNSNATTIAPNAVTTTKIADSNVTTAKIADSNVTTAKIADSNVTTAKIADDNVTNLKLANMTSPSIKGRATAGTGDPEDLSMSTAAGILGSSLATVHGSASIIANGLTLERAALTGDVTASQNSNATTIAAGVVTNSKLANMATQTFKGRTTAGTGSPEDLSVSQAATMIASAGVFGLLAATKFWSASNSLEHVVRLNGIFDLSTGSSQNNLSIGNVSVVTINPSASITITGMVPASTSQIVLLLNRSSGNDVVRCDSSGAGSSAANRFVANFNLGAGEAALCWYSNSASRWMVVGLTGRSEYIRAAPTVLQDVFCLDLPFSTTTVGQIDNQSLPFSNVWRVTPSGGDILLTGIDPASPGLSVTDGRVLFIFNLSTGSDRVTVASEHASSSAANRFTLHATSLDINPRHSAIAVYDGTSSRWRLAALW